MHAELMIQTISALVGIKRPVYMRGGPGLGKTAIASHVAENLSLPIIHIHAPSLLVENLGIPFPVPAEKKVEFFLTGMLPVVGSPFAEQGIVLLDEAGQCADDIQKVLANIIQAREVYGHKILDGWSFILTGNRTEDRAGANRLLTHFADRMTILDLDFDVEGWCFWAEKAGVNEKIISYARFNPNNINHFDPNRAINATPRSWAEGVSRNMEVVPREALMDVIAGDVGQGPAVEFMGYLEYYGILPSKKEFLAEPERHVKALSRWTHEEQKDAHGLVVGWKLIQRKAEGNHALEPSIAYALAGMLMLDMSEEGFEPAMDAAAHLPKDLGSNVFLTYLKRVKTIPVTHMKRMRQEITRYNGVVLSEEQAEQSLGLVK